MEKLKFTQAFTIIELMAVMVIIMIISGMVMGVSRMARQKALEGKAKSMIAALEIAISMYHTDTGAYPSETNNAALVADLTEEPGAAGTIPGQNGPYMEFKDEDLAVDEVVDPWKKAYHYAIMEGKDPMSTTVWGNTNSFNLWSEGPNKTDDSSDGTTFGDDVYNW